MVAVGCFPPPRKNLPAIRGWENIRRDTPEVELLECLRRFCGLSFPKQNRRFLESCSIGFGLTRPGTDAVSGLIALAVMSRHNRQTESKMEIRLTCTDAVALKQEIVLRSFPAAIGRGVDAAVRIDDTWLSRVHCEIDYEKGTLVVRDLDSRNGTLVNGEPIRRVELSPGDTLTIGLSTFVVAPFDARTNRPSHVYESIGN